MVSELENIIKQLLIPDNEVIKKASEQMKVLFKNHDIVPMFCQVLGTSDSSEVRQYAAVLLRKKNPEETSLFCIR